MVNLITTKTEKNLKIIGKCTIMKSREAIK